MSMERGHEMLRWTPLVVVLLAGVAGGWWMRGTATSFTPFPAGAYVAGDGVKYPIAFTPDDLGALDSFREGPAIASVDDAASQLAPASAAPRAAPTPAPPANPAVALVGQGASDLCGLLSKVKFSA